MYNSKIEWTDTTWNPVRGCSRVSEGCRHCYAEVVAHRYSGPGMPYEGLTTTADTGRPRWNNEIMLVRDKLEDPLRWQKPRRVFVNSMSDLFHEKVPLDYIEEVFDVMRRAERHQFQILTKRDGRLARLNSKLTWPPNVWMGVSIENDETADRVKALRKTDAAVKFLSVEPLLGPIDHLNLDDINWVIIGGESGPHARMMEAAWAIRLRILCRKAGVACFVKQLGTAWSKRGGLKDKKGGDISEFPTILRVREYPQHVA